MGLEFALCRVHSTSLATRRLDYGTNTSSLTSGGLGVGLVSITGEVPRVKWEVKRNTPEAARLSSPCEQNILPHHTAQGSVSFERRQGTRFLGLPSLLHTLSFAGGRVLSLPASHVSPEAGPTCGQAGRGPSSPRQLEAGLLLSSSTPAAFQVPLVGTVITPWPSTRLQVRLDN